MSGRIAQLFFKPFHFIRGLPNWSNPQDSIQPAFPAGGRQEIDERGEDAANHLNSLGKRIFRRPVWRCRFSEPRRDAGLRHLGRGGKRHL